MRFRVLWAKRGKLRYLSHHDEALMFERSARRARLPLAYSQGFTPHARIAFGCGLPVGYGSEVELLDMRLTEPLSPESLVERFNRGLPSDIRALAAEEVAPGAPSLDSLVHAADYELGSDASWLPDEMARFMELERYEVTRPYKGGTRVDDLRAGVLGWSATASGVSVRCAMKPRSVRPSDVFRALESAAGRERTRVSYERRALLTERDGGYEALSGTPLRFGVPA